MTAQEIMLVDISVPSSSMSVAEQGVLAELDRVNEELDRYTSKAEKEDYAFAIASGIVAGAVDSLYVGETHLFGEGTDEARAKVNERVNRFIQKYASDRGYEGQRLKGAIAHLEDNFKVAQDNVWKGAGIGISAKDHHLADLAHHPTPLGLAAAIVVQFLHVGTFVGRDGKWHFLQTKATSEEIVSVLIPAAMTGFLNWIVYMAQRKYEGQIEDKIPSALVKLVRIASSAPMLLEVAKCANNWFGHLVSDMGGSRNTPGGGMGIPGVMLSLLYECAALPILKDTGLPSYLDQLYTKEKFDLRHELVAVEALGKQAIPVLLNEVIVRMGYFVMRFARQFGAMGNAREIDWANVVPFNNRTIDRMLTVSSMTLSMADMADAAVRASMESAGDWVLFSQKFVARYNVVATGRVAVAIVREASNEAREVALLREKRKLMEAKVAFNIDRLREYQTMLEERVDAYLAEDLQAFFEGFVMMDRGLMEGDSDLVIGGNVVIQRVLGREPQFSNQEEFDALMDSDEDFVF